MDGWCRPTEGTDPDRQPDKASADPVCSKQQVPDVGFRRDRPTDWRPTDVRNPQGLLNTHFTNPTAWDLIAARLENGEDVELVELNKPKGRLGYVMLIDLGPDVPQLYVKLQLGAGIVIGRSFHYTDHD